MKLEIIKMLKMSAFYLDKQSSFIPKINMWHVSNRDFKIQNFWFLDLLATLRYLSKV